MPTITVEGFGSFEALEGQKLVLAIEEAGVDIGHRCGGYARCTTCRVRIFEGEPEAMTQAESDKLQAAGHLGKIRLACQILVEGDMTVEPLMRVSTMGWTDPGPPPAETITPEPEWTERPDV